MNSTPENPPVTAADLKLLRDQVDQLQVAAAEPQKPWYLQRPSLTSLVALLVSVVTFAISHNRASMQEIRSKKEDLRNLVVEVVNLQREFAQVATEVDPVKRETASSLLNTHRVLYLEAAELLVDELEDFVASSEYGILAFEKARQSDFKKAEAYFERARDAAREPVAKATALRNLASFYFNISPLQNIENGRGCFRQAIDCMGDAADDYSNYTKGFTYEAWGVAERSNNGGGNEQFQGARTHYERLSPTNPLRKWALESFQARTAASLPTN